MTSLQRRAFMLGLAGATGLAITGCARNQPGDAPSPNSSAQDPNADAAFPVTIKHARGETTIEAKPQRVVTIGYNDHETVLALGTMPVGVRDWFGERPYGDWPWVEDLWQDPQPEIVSVSGGGLNFEAIASLRPDLILGLYAGDDEGTMSEANYKRLSTLAPTVANDPEYAAYTTPWRAMARVAATALGELPAVEKLITAIESEFAAAREAHPEFAEQTAVVVDAGSAPAKYYPFSSQDPRGQFLTALGFKPATEIDAEIGESFGMWLPAESVTMLDVDRLILLLNPDGVAALDSDRLYNTLAVVKEDRDVRLPYDVDDKVGAALAFNTVLSISYGIKTVLPYLTP